MAAVGAQATGRFPWVVVLPLLSLDICLEELPRPGERRLRGVLRGLSASGVSPIPLLSLYERPTALDLPICVHSATGAFTTYDLFAGDRAFQVQLRHRRVSFVLSTASGAFPQAALRHHRVTTQSVPYAVHDRRALRRRGRPLLQTHCGESRLRRLPDR